MCSSSAFFFPSFCFNSSFSLRSLRSRTFDVAIVTYGRLRRNAEILAGRVGQFISVGGFPGYRGYMNAPLFDPPGFPVPTREDAPKVFDAAQCMLCVRAAMAWKCGGRNGSS